MRQLKRYIYLGIIVDYIIGRYIAQMLQNPTNIFLDIGRVNVNGSDSHTVVNVALVKRNVTCFMSLIRNNNSYIFIFVVKRS